MSLGDNREQPRGAAAGECEIQRNEGDQDLLLLSSPRLWDVRVMLRQSSESEVTPQDKRKGARRRAANPPELQTPTKQVTRRPTRFPAACLPHPCLCSDGIQLRVEVRKTNTEDTSYTGSPIARLMAAERMEAGEV